MLGWHIFVVFIEHDIEERDIRGALRATTHGTTSYDEQLDELP